MTPDEAVRHEWLQPSSSSAFIMPKSSTREHLKENTGDAAQNSLLQKYQRSQPLTPNTILPEIKTPSNRSTTNRFTKERAKGKRKIGDFSSIVRTYIIVQFPVS